MNRNASEQPWNVRNIEQTAGEGTSCTSGRWAASNPSGHSNATKLAAGYGRRVFVIAV